MLLIYPPVAKACEPPAGIAKLSGALGENGIVHDVLDSNLEGLLYLLNASPAIARKDSDRWTTRALKHIKENLGSIKNPSTFNGIDCYTRITTELDHALQVSTTGDQVTLGLSNYQQNDLSPLRSGDLLRAAEKPEENPFYEYFSKRLSERLDLRQTSVVGFSLNYLSQALTTFSMVGFLRRQFPGLKIVAGGGLVTSWTRNPYWKNPFGGLIDRMVTGPGEGQLLEMFGRTATGGAAARPDYGLFPRGDYLSPGFVLPFAASTGCYWNRCVFCPEQAEGNPYMPLPPRRVADDLALLTKENSPALIHILDNAVSAACMEELIQRPPGAPWYAFARFSKTLTDLDFCRSLRQSGCVMLKLGLESGDQGVLDKLRKGIDLSIASLALKALRLAGIATYVYLLFGTPAEDRSAAMKTLEFTAAHHDEISFLNLAIFNMPINSPDAQTLEVRTFYEGDLALYTDFVHPAGWDRKAVRRFLDAEFRKHPAISPILRRDPPFFTSNHAPFFVMHSR